MKNNNIVIGVDRSISNSYLVSYLYQSNAYFTFVDNIKEAISDYGIKVFIWNTFFDFNEIKENIFIITDNFFLKDLLKIENIQIREAYIFKAINIFEIGINCSFMVKRKVLTFSGFSEYGNCLDNNFRKIRNSGIKYIQKNNIKFISYPFNILKEIIGLSNEYRPIYSETVKKFYCEIGPTIDYCFLRKLTNHIFTFSFNKINLPYINHNRSIKNNGSYSIRIDADGFSKKCLNHTLNLALESSKKFTWYIDIYSWLKHGGIHFIKELRENNQNIQIHSFRHMTYRNFLNNFLNISIAKIVFKFFNIKAVSFVSPFGFYNFNYQKVISKFSFIYTSEFGFNINDIASFPFNNKSYPLQIPTNNASITTLRMSGFSKKEIFDHLYESTIKLAKENTFAILYEHPVNGIGEEFYQYKLLIKKLDKVLKYKSIEDYANNIERNFQETNKYNFLDFEKNNFNDYFIYVDYNNELKKALKNIYEPLETDFLIPYEKAELYTKLVKKRKNFFKKNLKNEYESNFLSFLVLYLFKSLFLILKNFINRKIKNF